MFAQPLQQIVLKHNSSKFNVNDNNTYYGNTENYENETVVNNVSDKSRVINDDVYRPVKDNEPARIFYAPQQNGVIGKSNNSEGENPYDNYFTVELPNDLVNYKATLTYDVYGVKSATQTTKSINNHIAFGGQIIEVSDEWIMVKEHLPAAQLKQGVNEIYFNRRNNTTYQYKIRNLSITLERTENSSPIFEGQVLKSDGKYYLAGVNTNPDVKFINVYGYSVPVKNGIFEHVFSELPPGLNELNISYPLNGKNYEVIVPVENSNSSLVFDNAKNNVSEIYPYTALADAPYSFESICVDLNENVESVPAADNKFIIQGLPFKDIRIANEDIAIVTGGNFSAYRIQKFSGKEIQPLQIHLKYDETEIPGGYTAKDVRTFYFDKNHKSWKALAVDSLDYENNEIISTSITGGDTDYINGVIKVPDSPEVGSFAPTMMSDMKYATPAAGVVSIAPPSPNSNGTATTSFPIKIPQGRAGVQPSLQVSYSSEAGNGWMGIGWNLATPAVSINTKWGVPRFDPNTESEIYSLNGSDLVLKNGTEYTNPHRTSDIARSNERIFYERKEGAYNHIIRHGNAPSNYWWEVTDKQGNKTIYGAYYDFIENRYKLNDKTVIRDDSGNITHWALTTISDTQGNYALYEYNNIQTVNNIFEGSPITGKEFYLEKISYTLWRQISAAAGQPVTPSIPNQSYYVIDFRRNAYTLGDTTPEITRSDININARNGYLQVTKDVLTEIHISYQESGQNLQRIRSYKFDYEEKAFKKQQLTAISEYDKDDDLFYTNTIEYYDYDESTPIINNTPLTYGIGSFSNNVSSTLFDIAGAFTGAPKGSVLGTSTSSGFSAGLRFGVGIGFNPTSVNSTAGFSFNYSKSNSETKISFIDINGDGLPDKVYNSINEVYYKPNLLGTGSQDTWGTGILISSISSLSKTTSTTIGWGGDANIEGFGVGLSGSTTTNNTDNYFTDFNGDGLPDMVRGNRVQFNKHLSSNTNARVFDSNTAGTENTIIAGIIDDDLLNSMEFDPINIVHSQHPQFDHVKVWRAPISGKINIFGNAILRNLNEVNNVPLFVDPNGNYQNEVEVSIEKGNINSTEATIINSENDRVLLETIDSPVSISATNITVEEGDYIFFRVHNKEYGTGAEVEWNPTIIYFDGISEIPSGYTDENGKLIHVFNAQSDYLVHGSGNVKVDENASACYVNFNAPPIPDEVTDGVRFIVELKEFDLLGNVINNTKYQYSNGNNNAYIPINNSNNKHTLEFYTESDSNIDWTFIDWNPSYSFQGYNTNPIFPVVKYSMYDNLNENKYWFDNTEQVQPDMGSGDGSDAFYKISHNFLHTWDNFQNNNSLNINEFPVKVSWVIKAKTSNDEELLHKKVYYIHYNNNNSSFYFSYSETPNTLIINETSYDYNNNFEIDKTLANDILASGGNIYSAFYVSSYQIAINNPSDIIIDLDSNQQVSGFNQIILNEPFFTPSVSSSAFFGKQYRGWGQFLYNGGIELPYEEGVPVDVANPTSYSESGIDVSLFDYENQQMPNNPATAADAPNPGPVRYVFYSPDNVTNSYVADAIIHNSDGQIKAQYGYNNDGELVAKTGRFAESSVFDQFVDPATITNQQGVNGTVIAIKQYSRAKGSAESFEGNIEGLGSNVTSSESNSTILNMYIDMNGDRYPDMVTKNHIQYTSMLGGLTGDAVSSSFSVGEKSQDNTLGITISGMEPKSTQSDNASFFNKTLTNASSGIVDGSGTSSNARQYIDINGDGLPDRVVIDDSGVQVMLNTGYDFTESFTWEQQSGLSTISNRESTSFSLSSGGALSFNASFGLGIGGAKSTAERQVTFADVNGDGLPDLIKKIPNSFTYYYLNTGNGFIIDTPNITNIFYAGQDSIEEDTSLTINGFGSLTGGFIFPIPILPPPAFIPLKVIGTGSGSGNGSVSEKNITMQDWNGDGLIDILEGDSEYNSRLTVKYNTVDKTHLLKKVNTPLGGSWEITYERDGNTYKMPQSKWVLKTISTDDGFHEDGDYMTNNTITDIAYNEPNYDRREREFFGYKNVTINQINPNTSAIFRSVTKTYHNENYYLSGIEYLTITKDADFNLLSESATLYNILDPDTPIVNMDASAENNYLQAGLEPNAEALFDKSRLFAAPVKVTSKTFENGAALTAVKEFIKYDQYGNLKELIDKGENDDDAYKVYLIYNMSSLDNADNAYGLLVKVSIYNLEGDQLLRQRSSGINNFGKISSVNTYFTIGDHSKHNIRYDHFGNITKIDDQYNTSADGIGRYTKYISYDTELYTYPITVTNSFGESSSMEYEYLFGTPTLSTDSNGQQVRTRIDSKGRVTEVTGPNEMALEAASGNPDTAWTIRMEYKDSFTPGDASAGEHQHYAVTRHFDPEYAGGTNITTNQLLTVSIVDGFGQALQVKKTHFSDMTKWLINGFEKKDAFGRVLETYLPVTQTYTSDIATIDNASLEYYHIAPGSLPDDPVEMTYDSKDRVLTVKQPGETDISSMEYFIEEGRFVQKATNENGEITQTFETYTDIRGRQRKTVQNDTKTILYTYNKINELLKVIDENSETSYKYDMAGRTLEVRQPDRGLTTYTYDNASRLTEQSNANLIINGNQKIKYHYNYGRLKRIEYPQNPLNEVKYTYGAPGDPLAEAENAVGRLLKQEDATGVQVFGYGNMGEVTKNLRSVAVAGHHSFWFFTQWKYDSWNRINEIIYPDLEKVTYKYNKGGMVYKVENEIPNIITPQNIVDGIEYNDYGERISMTYGNGTITTYDYDVRRRMNTLQHTFAGSYQVNKEYTYDALSNITIIATQQPLNSLPGQEQLGGPVYHRYTYDNFNRLTDANGHYTGINDYGNNNSYLRQEYELHMEYNTDHTIHKKTQKHWQGEIASYGDIPPADRIPVHKSNYVLDYSGYAGGDYVAGEYGYVQQHAPRLIKETPGWVANPAADDPRIREKVIDYDANGNQTAIKETVGELEVSLRKNLWDEENRLTGVDLSPDDHDNRPVAVYTYDAGGERVVRYNYNRTNIYSNASEVAINTDENIMIYPSGLIMGKVQPVEFRLGPLHYTKHYYIGSERVSAKNGTAGEFPFYPALPLGESFPELVENFVRPESSTAVQDAGAIVAGVFNTFGVTPPPLNPDNDLENTIGGAWHGHGEIPLDMYYFHPDHLGSSSYITNKAGTVSQHMEYLPFGETLAEEHLNSINSPFKYNGKELDEETGNYYYSARYYDPKLSIFISVDPLVDRTRDAYGYCYQNPINLVDPTGMEPDWIRKINKDGTITYEAEAGDSALSLYKQYGEKDGFTAKQANDIVEGQLGDNYQGEDGEQKSNVEVGDILTIYQEPITMNTESTNAEGIMTTGIESNENKVPDFGFFGDLTGANGAMQDMSIGIDIYEAEGINSYIYYQIGIAHKEELTGALFSRMATPKFKGFKKGTRGSTSKKNRTINIKPKPKPAMTIQTVTVFGKKIPVLTGSKGGKYYINKNGNKTYLNRDGTKRK